MQTIKSVSRMIFGILFVAAGVNHFINPGFYEQIMPPYLPWHYFLVIASGAAEVVLGALLVFRRTSRWAAWGLILLLIAVFPANLHMAMNPENFPDIPQIAMLIRLPLQGLLILWAYWYTREVRQRS